MQLTGTQIRTARDQLQWSVETLAREAKLEARLVEQAEAEDGTPQIDRASLTMLRMALEEGGIVFGTEGAGGGVRLRGGSRGQSGLREVHPEDEVRGGHEVPEA